MFVLYFVTNVGLLQLCWKFHLSMNSWPSLPHPSCQVRKNVPLCLSQIVHRSYRKLIYVYFPLLAKTNSIRVLCIELDQVVYFRFSAVIPVLRDTATEKRMKSCLSFLFFMQFRVPRTDNSLVIFNYKSTILMKLFILNINLSKQHKRNNN